MTEKVVGWFVIFRVNGKFYFQKIAADMLPSFPESKKAYEDAKVGDPLPLTEAEWELSLDELITKKVPSVYRGGVSAERGDESQPKTQV